VRAYAVFTARYAVALADKDKFLLLHKLKTQSWEKEIKEVNEARSTSDRRASLVLRKKKKVKSKATKAVPKKAPAKKAPQKKAAKKAE
jgi:hypothetical protein